jgi:hypothetical protein
MQVRQHVDVRDRLLSAVERGLIAPLSRYGFSARGGGGDRGESVECSNGHALIRVSADWLEGELSVSLQRPGKPPIPIADLLDLTGVEGLRMTRLGRGVTVETLAATLKKIALALDEKVPELLCEGG